MSLRRLTLAAVFAALSPFTQAQVLLGDIVGDSTGAFHGEAITPVGDIDHDGAQDFAVGAANHTHAGLIGAGRVIVYSGLSRNVLHVLDGQVAGGFFGQALDGGTDFDLDGVPDLLVGAPGEGAVRVYSGADFSLLFEKLAASGWGTRVAFAGDVNGDGRSEIAASHPWAAGFVGGAVGRVQLYSSLDGSTLHTWSGTPTSRLGWALAAVGDWDGDGTPDLAMGAPHHATLRGRVQVVSGATGAVLFTRDGSNFGDEMGSSLARIGDVDGDGKPDLAVGAAFELAPGNQSLGAVRVLRSGTGSELMLRRGVDPSGGFGSSVSAIGDVDRDGRGDILVSEPGNGPGAAYVVSGHSGATLWTGVWQIGSQGFGYSVAGLGDIDNDGWPEFAVGSPFTSPPGMTNAGTVWIWRAVVQQELVFPAGPGDTLLEVYGLPLESGNTADLFVTQAPPSAPAWMVVSTEFSLLQFKGGYIVPQLSSSILLLLATDGEGRLSVLDIPGGLGPAVIYLQLITADPSLPQGLDFSNAVQCWFLP